jgi:hypothetical protein
MYSGMKYHYLTVESPSERRYKRLRGIFMLKEQTLQGDGIILSGRV